jgi:hypothetical protein
LSSDLLSSRAAAPCIEVYVEILLFSPSFPPFFPPPFPSLSPFSSIQTGHQQTPKFRPEGGEISKDVDVNERLSARLTQVPI